MHGYLLMHTRLDGYYLAEIRTHALPFCALMLCFSTHLHVDLHDGYVARAALRRACADTPEGPREGEEGGVHHQQAHRVGMCYGKENQAEKGGGGGGEGQRA